jgi:hypothetical protein
MMMISITLFRLFDIKLTNMTRISYPTFLLL